MFSWEIMNMRYGPGNKKYAYRSGKYPVIFVCSYPVVPGSGEQVCNF